MTEKSQAPEGGPADSLAERRNAYQALMDDYVAVLTERDQLRAALAAQATGRAALETGFDAGYAAGKAASPAPAEGASAEDWVRAIAPLMPADFKDWNENSPREWPEVTAAVIKALRADRDIGWGMAANVQPKGMQPCKGMNCGATDGKSHSAECFAEHAATVDPGVGERHREARYAGYKGEPFPRSASEDEQAAWIVGFKARLPAQAPAPGAETDDTPKATAYEYELERLIHDFVRTALVGSPSEATLHHLDQLIDTVRHPTINRNLRSMRRQVTNPRPPCPPFASCRRSAGAEIAAPAVGAEEAATVAKEARSFLRETRKIIKANNALRTQANIRAWIERESALSARIDAVLSKPPVQSKEQP